MATSGNSGAARARRKLDNENTHFSKFRWADHPKLREAIDEARQRMGGKLPIRFKVKL